MPVSPFHAVDPRSLLPPVAVLAGRAAGSAAAPESGDEAAPESGDEPTIGA